MNQFNMPNTGFDFNAQWNPQQAYMQQQNIQSPMQSPMSGMNTMGTQQPSWSWFGGENQMGVIPAGIQGLSALAQGWLGFQQLGLAKDSLAFQKDAFNKNYENQRQLTNQQLLDRQRARAAANPNAYASPDAAWQGQNLIGG